MSKRKTTNIPEVEISAEILKTIERDYNIGVYENIIDVSAYDNNNVDNANNDDNGDDNYEGVNFNDNSEINDSNVEDVYSQTSPSKNMDAKCQRGSKMHLLDQKPGCQLKQSRYTWCQENHAPCWQMLFGHLWDSARHGLLLE